MINDEFRINAEKYKRGNFDRIEWYDPFTEEPFSFHKKQIQALELLNDSSTTFIGYGGSARGGKSVLICAAAVFECFAYPGVRNLIGRRDLQMLWRTTYKTLYKVLGMFGFERGVDYNFNGKTYEMTFTENTSQIVAMNLELKPSDDEASEFGSLEITKAFIDQSENVNIKIIEKIQERVGSHAAYQYGLKGKVMEAFNPSKSHVNRRYWLPFRDKKESPSKKFVRALPSDNPGKEAVKWLEEKENDYENGIMSEKEYQKQIKGNFDYDADPTSLVDYDEIIDMFGNSTYQKGEIYITSDIAMRGSDEFIIYVWDGMNVIDRRAFHKSDGKKVYESIISIKNHYDVRSRNIVFDSDGLGMFLEGGFLPGSVSFVANSRPYNDQNYENLKTQCAFKLAENIRDYNIGFAAKIDSFVKDKIIEELQQLKERDSDKDGKLKMIRKETMKDNLGRSPDDLDNFIMRMIFEVQPKIDEDGWGAYG